MSRFDWRLSDGKHAWRLFTGDGTDCLATVCRQLGGPVIGPSTWGAIINARDGYNGLTSPSFNDVEEAVRWVENEVRSNPVLEGLLNQ